MITDDNETIVAVVSIHEKGKDYYVTVSDGNMNGHAVDMGNDDDDRNAGKA